jgi:hypothetical protein
VFQSIYQGLEEMLNYEGDDFQDVFLQSFQISYTGRYCTVPRNLPCLAYVPANNSYRTC